MIKITNQKIQKLLMNLLKKILMRNKKITKILIKRIQIKKKINKKIEN